MRLATGSFIALSIFALAACGGSSSSDGGGGAALRAVLGIPDYPFVDNDAMVVDPAHLDDAATAHCARRGGADAVLFLLEDLPFDAIDGLCAGALDDAPRHFGDLFLSGYFGGLWLRDAIGDFGAEPGAGEPSGEPTEFERGFLTSLAAAAADARALAADEDPAARIRSARDGLPLLLVLLGYNRGYLDATVERPPPGTPPFDPPLVCDGLLDCRKNGRPLATLDAYAAALERLAAPPNAAWASLTGLVDAWAAPFVGAGRGVWENILSDQDVSADAYGALLEVSAGYLIVTEAAILASMTAAGDEDGEAARCAALATTGLVAWSGSYFLGLASPAPAGTFPTLACVR